MLNSASNSIMISTEHDVTSYVWEQVEDVISHALFVHGMEELIDNIHSAVTGNDFKAKDHSKDSTVINGGYNNGQRIR